MFEQKYIDRNVTHTHHHTKHVTEKRAPTDESVRLLKELEDAAQNKVDRAVRLDFNGFKCVIQVYREMYLRDDIGWHILYDFNGAQQKVKGFFKEHLSREDNIRNLLNELSSNIAHNIFMDCLYKSKLRDLFDPMSNY